MIPAAFDYVRAESAEQAISLIGEHGDEAKLLAGGHPFGQSFMGLACLLNDS